MAKSPWKKGVVAGQAVAAVIARQIEHQQANEDFRPTRLTIDFFRPVPMRPLRVTTSTVRTGKRIKVADAEVLCDDEIVAHASCLLLKSSEQPVEKIWKPSRSPLVPPEVIPGEHPDSRGPIFGSDGHPTGWSRDITQHVGVTRKRMWALGMPAVEGDELSPFVAAAIVGEATSFVTNWSQGGVSFINSDLTLALSRMPNGLEMGIEADNHMSVDGIAIGTATLYDSLGSFGTCIVTSLSNIARQVSVENLSSHNSSIVDQSLPSGMN